MPFFFYLPLSFVVFVFDLDALGSFYSFSSFLLLAMLWLVIFPLFSSFSLLSSYLHTSHRLSASCHEILFLLWLNTCILNDETTFFFFIKNLEWYCLLFCRSVYLFFFAYMLCARVHIQSRCNNVHQHFGFVAAHVFYNFILLILYTMY